MWVAILLLLLLGVGVANLLLYFGNWRTYPWYVQVTCFVAWMFPFSIILILPLDLASTLYRACGPEDNCDEPFAYVSEQFLWVFWHILYWTMFSLTWFTIPVMQAWMRSGEFSSWSRFINAVKENLFWYAIFGAIGVVALLYIIFGLKKNTMGDLMDFLMAAANAWGLLLCTFMLGYGFVDIPRKLWYHANTRWSLRFLELQAPKTREAMVDSEAELYDVAKSRQDVAYVSRVVASDNALRPHVDKLLEKCPLALNERMPDDADRPSEVTVDYLKSLHARIKYGIRVHERHKAQYRFLLEKAWLLSDIIQNENNLEKKFKSPLVQLPQSKYSDIRLQFLWWWYIWIKPITMRALSVICILSSAALIWSESTFQVTNFTLSIPALILKHKLAFVAVEFISITFLLYMCTSAYSVLFQLKIFDYYVVVPDHHTDENSLLFVGAYLCRLMFPLCYNFLNMAQDDQNSVFVKYQGKSADLTPLLGDGFVTWVPQLVLLFSVLTLLNLYGRILRLFRVKQYLYAEVSRNVSDSDLEEGRNIISQARVMEERRQNRAGGPEENVRGGNFGTDRNRNTPRATNTKDLLAKYKSKKTNEEPQRSNAIGSTSTENLRESPVLSRSLPTGSSFSMKPSFFALKASAKPSNSEAAGTYRRLEDEIEDSSARRFGRSPTLGRSQENSPARGGASTERLNESRNPVGSARVFGSSNQSSPVPAPQQIAPPPKKTGPRNIFDDV
ncbi:LMBR1 domain-containing protein 2 [Dinochytrium kinnereticum]|nr:LMBR1 domain-containing protein 2 [Dinochytrium kinnereticum]